MPDLLQDTLAERARAQLGRVLKDKYHLDSLLGVGGMAAVFAATHRNGNRVAVKLLHPELMLNSEVRARFLREGYVANKVDHPGTVRVLDDDTDDGTAFLVMELLIGETVQVLASRSAGVLSAERVLSLAEEVLDVLAAAHDKGIVHRDIKPENLFLTTDGALKVLDFGIARIREGATSVTVTKTGNPFGSPAYMAPEQALGRTRQVGPHSDIYAVGATMFSLLSGELVHEAESAHEMVIVTATTPARSLAGRGVWVPPRVVELVDRALSFEARGRWPDARSMREAVRATLASLGGSPPMITQPTAFGTPDHAMEFAATAQVEAVSRPEAMTAPPTTTAAPRARSRWPRWPIAAGALAFLGLAGVAIRSTTHSPATASAVVGEPRRPEAPPAALPVAPPASAASRPESSDPPPVAANPPSEAAGEAMTPRLRAPARPPRRKAAPPASAAPPATVAPPTVAPPKPVDPFGAR